LEKIFSTVDKVIILGDFWDSSLMTFDNFINSDWRLLFPILKQKHAVYVYGNHDKKETADSRVFLFSDTQTTRYKFEEGGKTFITEHGDRFFKNHILFLLTYGGPFKRFFMSRFFIVWQFVIVEDVLTKIFGTKYLANKGLKFNIHIKKIWQKEAKNGEYLICGHTHAAEMDLKNHFINTGLIRHGLGQYVVIDGEKIEAKEEWYSKPNWRA
jgi:predicted phosphodiesterase